MGRRKPFKRNAMTKRDHMEAYARLRKQGMTERLLAMQMGLTPDDVKEFEAARNAVPLEEPQPEGYVIPGETDQKWSNTMTNIWVKVSHYGERFNAFLSPEAIKQLGWPSLDGLTDSSTDKFPVFGATLEFDPKDRVLKVANSLEAHKPNWKDALRCSGGKTKSWKRAEKPLQLNWVGVVPKDLLEDFGSTPLIATPVAGGFTLKLPPRGQMLPPKYRPKAVKEVDVVASVPETAVEPPATAPKIKPEDVLPPASVHAAKTVGGKGWAPNAALEDRTKPAARQRTAQEELDLQPPAERVLTQMEQVTWVINQLAANHADRTGKQLCDFLVNLAEAAEKL